MQVNTELSEHAGRSLQDSVPNLMHWNGYIRAAHITAAAHRTGLDVLLHNGHHTISTSSIASYSRNVAAAILCMTQ